MKDITTAPDTAILFTAEKGWEDTSYGNDESPSCEHDLEFMAGPDRYVLKLWIDEADAKERPLERQDQERFNMAVYYCEDNCDPAYGTEWLADILASDSLDSILNALKEPQVQTSIRSIAAGHAKAKMDMGREDFIGPLSQLYQRWCLCEGLPAVCAEELRYQDLTIRDHNTDFPVENRIYLTNDQRAWLLAFQDLWEQSQDFEQEYYSAGRV